MSIAYPLTMPANPGFISSQLRPMTIVGTNRSPATGQQQIYPWPGQWLEFTVGLPPMQEAQARLWAAFFLALNGPTGTFYFAPPARLTTRGTISGSVVVNNGALPNNTNLPMIGGTGAFAVGDWVQVGNVPSPYLHRVLQVNAGSLEVFPNLRFGYAYNTPIIYNNPVGLFRLSEVVAEEYNEEALCEGMSFSIMEAI